MTLVRPIVLLSVLLIVLLYVISLSTLYRGSAHFVEHQLYNEAMQTAESLSLALSGANDAKAKSLIDEAFEQGRYEAIVYDSRDGGVIYERKESIKGDAPEWFVSMIGLPVAKAEKNVKNAKQQSSGTLRIEGNREGVYSEFWKIAKEMLAAFVLFGALFVGIMYYASLKLLRPLRKIREQAEAFTEGYFTVDEELPRIEEFRSVVKAMNAMAYKVKGIFKEENEASRRLNILMQDDRETHLKNRDFFMSKLKSVLSTETRFSEGFIIALRLEDPETIRNEQGASMLQKQLLYVSDIARIAAVKVEDGCACRVREYDIMMILPSLNETETQELINGMHYKCSMEGCRIDMAAIAYHNREKISEVLAHADYALMQAASDEKGVPIVYRHEGTDVPSWGHDKWRKYILDAMKNDRFVLNYQPIMQRSGGIIQKELLLRLRVDGKLLNAGAFYPVVQHLALDSEVDRYVLEKMAKTFHSTEIAVNVSEGFVQQSATVHWLTRMHEEWSGAGLKIAFEISNGSALDDIEAAEAFSKLTQKLGYRFGIDHFDAGGNEYTYLQKIKPSYVKIDAACLLSIKEGPEAPGTGTEFLSTAESVGIELIATGVDSKETADRLFDSGISMIQGFWVGNPHEEKI